jgi:hypothetical protein
MMNEEQALLDQIKRIQDQLDCLSACYSGTLQVKFIRCGKPNCYCAGAKGGKRHGPYYYLERRVCGKVKTVYIGRSKKNADDHNIHRKANKLKKKLRNLKKRYQELREAMMSMK